jgi:hypothetical protein
MAVYDYHFPAVVVRDSKTPSLSMFRFDTGTVTHLMQDASRFIRFRFVLDKNLLFFGMTPEGTDVITYPIVEEGEPTIHTLTQTLSEWPQLVSGRAFVMFDNTTVMVFDANTGTVLHEHTLIGAKSRIEPRPDGEAYAVRTDDSIIIQYLNGEPQTISLNN